MNQFFRTQQPECDPYGRKASTPGAKLDDGKTRMGLVVGGFARALKAVDQQTGIAHAAHAAWNALARLDLMIRAQQGKQAGKPEGFDGCGNVGMEASE